jgi:hypothetical protein
MRPGQARPESLMHRSLHSACHFQAVDAFRQWWLPPSPWLGSAEMDAMITGTTVRDAWAPYDLYNRFDLNSTSASGARGDTPLS